MVSKTTVLKIKHDIEFELRCSLILKGWFAREGLVITPD